MDKYLGKLGLMSRKMSKKMYSLVVHTLYEF